MEIRIGVVYTARELNLETDDSVDTVTATIESTISAGDGVLWLTDKKGRRVGVPVDKIAYVEIVTDAGGRKVGFGAS
ncbi:MAG: hypothetical protein JWM72_1954 [Actinomycetia bacterium]|jgi:hypothetical protein|nr:hypothetical protein [Actinomycetes bacterium]MDQ1381609.1 hypothetical protein [Actinomycetota bacterium]